MLITRRKLTGLISGIFVGLFPAVAVAKKTFRVDQDSSVKVLAEEECIVIDGWLMNMDELKKKS